MVESRQSAQTGPYNEARSNTRVVDGLLSSTLTLRLPASFCLCARSICDAVTALCMQLDQTVSTVLKGTQRCQIDSLSLDTHVSPDIHSDVA